MKHKVRDVVLSQIKRHNDWRNAITTNRLGEHLTRRIHHDYARAVSTITRLSKIRMRLRSPLLPPRRLSRSNRMYLRALPRPHTAKPRRRILHHLLESNTHTMRPLQHLIPLPHLTSDDRIRTIVVRGLLILENGRNGKGEKQSIIRHHPCIIAAEYLAVCRLLRAASRRRQHRRRQRMAVRRHRRSHTTRRRRSHPASSPPRRTRGGRFSHGNGPFLVVIGTFPAVSSAPTGNLPWTWPAVA